MKRLALEPETAKTNSELGKIETAGELFAKVHSYDMTLGDTKPENVMVHKDGTVYLLDFEQATQDGDKAWDNRRIPVLLWALFAAASKAKVSK